MDTNYTILFKNQSSNAGSFIVFQQDPGIGVPNVFPLAWFAKYTYPTTTAKFTWQVKYNFVWEETGELIPGVIFSATQNPDVDLRTSNQITLFYDAPNQAYNFIDQKAGPKPDLLYINQDKTVPLKQAAVGIGMAGFGTFVVQAQPNLNLTFSPHPKYYVAFGTFQAGQVLDIQQMSNIAEVEFPPGVYTMTVTLNPNNEWTIGSSKERNNALIGARRHFPELFSRQEPGGLQARVILRPNEQRVIAGSVEVKVSNTTTTDGKVRVKCPNVPEVDYSVSAQSHKNILIPLGDSTFTNIGRVDLELSW